MHEQYSYSLAKGICTNSLSSIINQADYLCHDFIKFQGSFAIFPAQSYPRSSLWDYLTPSCILRCLITHFRWCLFAVLGQDCPPFDPEFFICCNGVINVRPPNPRCCHSKVFDSELYMCCNSIINPRPGGTPQCCQSYAHDSEKYICCYGTSNIRPENAQCCSYNAFNSVTQMCCAQVVNPRPSNGGCCYNTSFESSTHKCCYQTVVVPIGEDCPPQIEHFHAMKATRPRKFMPKGRGHLAQITAPSVWIHFSGNENNGRISFGNNCSKAKTFVLPFDAWKSLPPHNMSPN